MKNRYAIINTVPALGNPPVRTREDAEELANAMYKDGHYPAGLSPCFVAGINGDTGELGDCPFRGEDFCTCEPLSV